MNNETDKRTADDGETEASEEMLSSEGHEELVPSEATPEQIEEWREKAAKAEEHWERLLRVSADFDNFRKRAARERQEAVKYANESLIEKLLPVLDSFDMALAAAQPGQGTNASDALRTGVDMIYSQLRNVLTEAGLEAIDSTNQPFDPNWHEAVSEQPSEDVPEGHVMHQLRKGYRLKDRLLRPASVVVAKQPPA
jgi:molecular chaperone GrpE